MLFWLQGYALEGFDTADWFDRYSKPVEESRLPRGTEARNDYAAKIGQDGMKILEAIYDNPTTPQWLRKMTALETLRIAWVHQYWIDRGQLYWRSHKDLPLGTQTEIAHRIQKSNADYILALKANHPTLYQEVEQWFENSQTSDFHGIEYSHDVRVESGHHRREKREVTAVALNQMGGLYKQAQWSGLQTIVRVVRTRHLWNKTTQEVMFYLSSLPPDAQQLGKAIRQHWSIENQLHWVLDVTFGEDSCRIRTGNAPENIALLKRWSINLLNQETSFKRSTRQKARRASMDSTYLLKVINASIPLQSNPSEF